MRSTSPFPSLTFAPLPNRKLLHHEPSPIMSREPSSRSTNPRIFSRIPRKFSSYEEKVNDALASHNYSSNLRKQKKMQPVKSAPNRYDYYSGNQTRKNSEQPEKSYYYY
ncbi:hypothetical protein VNO78_25718 [Psophocarpus tetragonolobus]|uniref:Uncharacterized protein n=1 Tax=Psophocarpus tetragonolobus TaxID=3891 RepID=A0AAN9S6Y3_PSOTE